MRGNSEQRAEKPSGIGTFRAKNGDFHLLQRVNSAYEPPPGVARRRHRRAAGCVRRARPARRKPREFSTFARPSRKSFPKIRICAILLAGGGLQISALRKSVKPRAPMSETEEIVFHDRAFAALCSIAATLMLYSRAPKEDFAHAAHPRLNA
jgi:hypothetical protein